MLNLPPTLIHQQFRHKHNGGNRFRNVFIESRESEGPSCKNMNRVLKKIIWFLGTAKAAIVCLLMMLIAWLIESDEAVENFVEAGCLSNDRDENSTVKCTTLTLTKISNVDFPEFGPPAFSFSYEFCNDGSFDSKARYPDQDWTPNESNFESLGKIAHLSFMSHT